ncbi:hypothetical protein [Exiguobacterium sp. s133]|uniref:hypothetical protein n=1 Tax=Exiguobacterium sp. s133 TaxID=2751213 RepID=UPI001BE751C4|nr:hypothetical protein [Exiguobacterium sp. s133]
MKTPQRYFNILGLFLMGGIFLTLVTMPVAIDKTGHLHIDRTLFLHDEKLLSFTVFFLIAFTLYFLVVNLPAFTSFTQNKK